MASFQKVGGFQLNTIAGNKSVTGIGFQPKAVMFFHTPDTVDIVNQTANHNFSWGATDGVRQYATCQFSSNGAVVENGFTIQTNTNCLVGSINANNAWRCTIVSFDTDGFTINQPAGGLPPVGVRVGYIAFGGGDLTAYVGAVQMGAVGAQSVTGVGFQPTGLIAYSIGWTSFTANPTTLVNQGNFMNTSLGFCDSALNQRSTGNWFRGANIGVTVRGRIQSNTRFMIGPYNTSPSTTNMYELAVTSMDVDGFSWTNTVNASTRYMMFLAIGGPATKVGTVTSPSISGPFTVSSLGFTPASVLTSSTFQFNYNLYEGFGAVGSARGALFSAGMGSSPTEQLTFGYTTKDYTTTSVEGHHSESTKIMRRFAHDPFTTLEMDFALQALSSGMVTFNCTTSSGTLSQINYMAIEGTTITPPPPSDPTGGSGDPGSPDSSFLYNMI
jgi:hypothetical protein